MTTLQDWLSRDAINMPSLVYQRGKKHLIEEARKLIKGILGSLADMHISGRYHGGLDKPENYILKQVQNHDITHIGSDWRYGVEFREDPNAEYNAATLAQGQLFDTQCVLKIIFGGIIPDEITEYPPDVKDLHDCLEKNHQNKSYLANHPSIWSWQDGFHFFLKLDVWKKYNGVNKLRTALGHVQNSNYASWQTEIQPGSPLDKVLKDGHYDNTVVDLVRFVRNVFLHIREKEKGPSRRFKYIDGMIDRMDQQFVENEITKTFPLLLVHVHASIWLTGTRID